ncbi:hypothetical protein J4427_03095, partial [Candidatus Woesearchaeota archaeon]|nr:hypothetical protein [Candidatus Woesearchaeota archaeon]
GLIEVLLTGDTQYVLEESDCKNPNEEGVGKKSVYKYQEGSLISSYETECTVLPAKTVPFYSLISVIITLAVLIGFYMFRSKIFSYFHKK